MLSCIRICLLLTLLIIIGAFAEAKDTVITIGKADTTAIAAKHFDPLRVGGYSALLPGAGQVYTGHYIKAGALVALEAITASVAYFWYDEYNVRRDRATETERSLALVSSWQDSMYTLEEVRLHRFDTKSARYSMYNALSWMVGGYVYNVCDAVKSSGYFNSTSERSALKAGWLAAIPALGLGQLYNGEIGKAGIIMMTQTSLAVIAMNEHRLMKRAQREYIRAFSITDTAGLRPVGEEYGREWDGRQQNAFKNRNSYIWYSLFFYGYGILDAIVDAHLHDYEPKMRTYPDLNPELSAVGFTIEYQF